MFDEIAHYDCEQGRIHRLKKGGAEWGLVRPCGARSARIYFARITNSVVIVGGVGAECEA